MWTNSSSKIYPGLRKEDVWRLWTDVNGWVTWHRDLEYCRMNEPFAVGAHFLLKPNGAPEFNIEIVDVVDGRKFTDCTSFFGAKMYDTHELEETSAGLRLTNTLVVAGFLCFFWVKLVAHNVARGAAEENDALAMLARSSNG